MRVAIIGAGPKGLFALERLLDHAARRAPCEPLTITIFDAHPEPGRGPVYESGQPDYLTMNYPAAQVDMWWPGGGVVPPQERLPFAAWAGVEGELYPARSRVGDYLADGFRLLLAHVPEGVEVELRRDRVVHLRRDAADLIVHSGDEPSPHDAVLLATGHEWAGDDGLARSNAGRRFISGVFPVRRRLSVGDVPVGADVAVRGFGLSFLDAAQALSEGRGGRFEPEHGTRRLRYIRGGCEPARIVPFSRTGRPVLPKPPGALATSLDGLDAVIGGGAEALVGLGDPQVPRDLIPVLAVAVGGAMAAAGLARAPAIASAKAWLEAATAGTALPGNATPLAQISHALDVGSGDAAPGLHWALGHVWRSMYPSLVQTLSRVRREPAESVVLANLTAEMERVAFGPSPRNAAKLLALVEADLVDLSWLDGGDIPTGDADVLVDSVLPASRVPESGAIADVVAAGHARVAEGSSGLEVDDAAGCIGDDGRATPGLAAYGRPTEGWIVGNDTLTRTLHPLIDSWAQTVASRAAQPAVLA